MTKIVKIKMMETKVESELNNEDQKCNSTFCLAIMKNVF